MTKTLELLHSKLHIPLSNGIPLCAMMVGKKQEDPTDYLCDIPSEKRHEHMGEKPCSACKGCVPREQDPVGVIRAINAEHKKKNRLQTFYDN